MKFGDFYEDLTNLLKKWEEKQEKFLSKKPTKKLESRLDAARYMVYYSCWRELKEIIEKK